MTHVKVFSDRFTMDVAKEVEKFLNSSNWIRIIDISWFTIGTITVCTITYFEVK